MNCPICEMGYTPHDERHLTGATNVIEMTAPRMSFDQPQVCVLCAGTIPAGQFARLILVLPVDKAYALPPHVFCEHDEYCVIGGHYFRCRCDKPGDTDCGGCPTSGDES